MRTTTESVVLSLDQCMSLLRVLTIVAFVAVAVGASSSQVESIVISIIAMLSSPNDESPANVDAAKQWRDVRLSSLFKLCTVLSLRVLPCLLDPKKYARRCVRQWYNWQALMSVISVCCCSHVQYMQDICRTYATWHTALAQTPLLHYVTHSAPARVVPTLDIPVCCTLLSSGSRWLQEAGECRREKFCTAPSMCWLFGVQHVAGVHSSIS
jgi:hypothetical protein